MNIFSMQAQSIYHSRSLARLLSLAASLSLSRSRVCTGGTLYIAVEGRGCKHSIDMDYFVHPCLRARSHTRNVHS